MIFTDNLTHKNEQFNFLKRNAINTPVITTITPIKKIIQSDNTSFLLN